MRRSAKWRCIVSNSVVYAITDTVIDTIVSVTVSVFYACFAEITVKWAILLTLQHIYSLYFLDMVVLPVVPCLYPPHIALAYNDTLSCVQWCQYARKCVGDEMYEVMMKIAARQKATK